MQLIRVLTAIALIAGTVGCIDLTSNADALSLNFNRLPAPSVVVGDTIRDSLGAAARLRAETSDSTRPARFVPLDTNIRVDSAGYLTARSRDTSSSATNIVRIIAQAGATLQTPALTVVVTVRPDVIVKHGTAPTALAYDPAATGTVGDTANRSVALDVRVRHLYTPGEPGAAARDTVVRSYYVRFQLVSIATGVADNVLIVDDARNVSSVDTTDVSGVASRRIRVFPKEGATANDSVVVHARVMYRNADIAGSPLRIVVPLRRK